MSSITQLEKPIPSLPISLRPSPVRCPVRHVISHTARILYSKHFPYRLFRKKLGYFSFNYFQLGLPRGQYVSNYETKQLHVFHYVIRSTVDIQFYPWYPVLPLISKVIVKDSTLICNYIPDVTETAKHVTGRRQSTVSLVKETTSCEMESVEGLAQTVRIYRY